MFGTRTLAPLEADWPVSRATCKTCFFWGGGVAWCLGGQDNARNIQYFTVPPLRIYQFERPTATWACTAVAKQVGENIFVSQAFLSKGRERGERRESNGDVLRLQ